MVDYNELDKFPPLDINISTHEGRMKCYDVWYHFLMNLDLILIKESTCCFSALYKQTYKDINKSIFIQRTTASTWNVLKKIFLRKNVQNIDSNHDLKRHVVICTGHPIPVLASDLVIILVLVLS